MSPDPTPPGPDPSTLDTADHVPQGIEPLSMRITYSSNSLSDYIAIDREGLGVRLELAEPLLGVVRKATTASDLVSELQDALAAVSVTGIIEYFKATIAEYANHFLAVPAIPESASFGAIVYLLKKLYDSGFLFLGRIHQASTEELGSWLSLIEEAKEHPDITVH